MWPFYKKIHACRRSTYDITELTWENGQLAFNGLGSSLLFKQSYGGDTLESIVRQGYNTTFKSFPSQHDDQQDDNQEGKLKVLSSSEKWVQNSSSSLMVMEQNRQKEEIMDSCSMPTFSCGSDQKKRARSESEKMHCENMKRYQQVLVDDQRAPELSACASASAAFCREKDSTMMTWPSFESPRSLKSSRKGDDIDSACNDFSENQDGERMTLEETCRSQSSARRSRVSAIHNQSERRRRDRINQKMKALQKLVPNASKTDKASMLDEVIQYLKQLQAQVQMMSNARNNMINQQMMMMMLQPSNHGSINIQQQQLQMSLLSRMGMFDNMARNMQNSLANPPLFPTSPFIMPQMINHNLNSIPLKINGDSSVPSFNNVYNAFLAQQSMNADFFNKMAATDLYEPQQTNRLSKSQASTMSQPNINRHGQ